MPFCPNCGREVQNGTAVCGGCNASLPDEIASLRWSATITLTEVKAPSPATNDSVEFVCPNTGFSLRYPADWILADPPVSEGANFSCAGPDRFSLIEVFTMEYTGPRDQFDARVIGDGIAPVLGQDVGHSNGRLLYRRNETFPQAEFCERIGVSYTDTGLETTTEYVILGHGRQALMCAYKSLSHEFASRRGVFDRALQTLRLPWAVALPPDRDTKRPTEYAGNEQAIRDPHDPSAQRAEAAVEDPWVAMAQRVAQSRLPPPSPPETTTSPAATPAGTTLQPPPVAPSCGAATTASPPAGAEQRVEEDARICRLCGKSVNANLTETISYLDMQDLEAGIVYKGPAAPYGKRDLKRIFPYFHDQVWTRGGISNLDNWSACGECYKKYRGIMGDSEFAPRATRERNIRPQTPAAPAPAAKTPSNPPPRQPLPHEALCDLCKAVVPKTALNDVSGRLRSRYGSYFDTPRRRDAYELIGWKYAYDAISKLRNRVPIIACDNCQKRVDEDPGVGDQETSEQPSQNGISLLVLIVLVIAAASLWYWFGR